MKKILLFIVLVCALIVLGTAYKRANDSGAADALDFIARHIDSRGNILDMQGDLSVKGPESIQWFDNGKSIKINYGKVKLDFPRDIFLTDATRQSLNKILIEFKYNKDSDKIRVYWKGEEIPRYVKE